MPATPLPPSGDQPERAPGGAGGAASPATPGAVAKTCDARGMAEIHRMFKAGFGEGRTLIDGVAEGDTVHAEVVADHLAMLSTGLHAHHEGEDTMLWDPLEQRAPSCAVHVERMKAQHAELLVHLTALDAVLPAWRASAGQRMPRASCPRSTGSITRSPRTSPTRRATSCPSWRP